jgi:hypothetical protein
MSHSKEINETSIRQLQITHVELKLYSDACSEPTFLVSALLVHFLSLSPQMIKQTAIGSTCTRCPVLSITGYLHRHIEYSNESNVIRRCCKGLVAKRYARHNDFRASLCMERRELEQHTGFLKSCFSKQCCTQSRLRQYSRINIKYYKQSAIATSESFSSAELCFCGTFQVVASGDDTG